jgi:hypothetical protein
VRQEHATSSCLSKVLIYIALLFLYLASTSQLFALICFSPQSHSYPITFNLSSIHTLPPCYSIPIHPHADKTECTPAPAAAPKRSSSPSRTGFSAAPWYLSLRQLVSLSGSGSDGGARGNQGQSWRWIRYVVSFNPWVLRWEEERLGRSING